MSKKLNTLTSIQLLQKYHETLLEYTTKNKQLQSQLEDLKVTLNLNHNLLYTYILNTLGQNEIITKLINENKSLWQENEDLINQILLLEETNAHLHYLIEDTPTEMKEEIAALNISNSKKQEEIAQKDNYITKLKSELDHLRKNALFKNARMDIIIVPPTQTNVENNNEIQHSKVMLRSIRKLIYQEKNIAELIDKQLKYIQEQIVLNKRDKFSNDFNLNENFLKFDDKKMNIDNNNSNKGIQNDIINQKNEKRKLKRQLIKTQGELQINNLLKLVTTSNTGGEADDEDSEPNIESKFKIGKKEKKKKKQSKKEELEALIREYQELKQIDANNETKFIKLRAVYKEMKMKYENVSRIARPSRSDSAKNSIVPLPSTEDITQNCG